MARLAAQFVDHRIALAGQDAVAIDSLCCKMMDISLDDVGYLTYLDAAGYGNIDYIKIDIIGSTKPEDHIIKYELASNAAYHSNGKILLLSPDKVDRWSAPPQQPQPGQKPAQPQPR